MARNKKRTKPITIVIAILAALAVLGAATAAFIMLRKPDSPVYSACTVEAGVKITPQDFLKESNPDAVFSVNSEEINTNVPGEYDVEIVIDGETFHSTLTVTDTIPPTGKGLEYTVDIGGEVKPEDLVTDITDATEVALSFETQPDTSSMGEIPVNVVLTDLGGNQTTVAGTLKISMVKPEIEIEAGGEVPSAKEFSENAGTVQFVTDPSSIDTSKVGSYPVKIVVDGENHEVRLKVIDTVPPVVSFKDVNSFTSVARKPQDFVDTATDLTSLNFKFVNEPDINLVGTQEVQISVTDEGGNEVLGTAKLNLKEDTDSPVISGVHDLSIVTGQTVAYKEGVSVSDECQEGLTLTVDNSKVNPLAAGVYEIVYTARDASGHETKETCTLTVNERVYSIDQVNSMADSVLARIINPAMSAHDKVLAIFNYVKSHIAYISHSEKGNYVRAAYEGLSDGKGDCYVYACTTKVLLTRAGIPNYDIAKIPAATQHYWNLVDIGSGWLHLDTTPRKDHPTIFLWDDPTMMAYSNAHNKSHNYDHSIYPMVVGSSEGTLVSADGTVDNEAALAQYNAALEAQKALLEAAAQAEAEQAAQEAATQAALLEQYQQALAAMGQ